MGPEDYGRDAPLLEAYRVHLESGKTAVDAIGALKEELSMPYRHDQAAALKEMLDDVAQHQRVLRNDLSSTSRLASWNRSVLERHLITLGRERAAWRIACLILVVLNAFQLFS